MEESRRRFLQIAGTGAAIGIAGCLDMGGEMERDDSMMDNDGAAMDPDSAEKVSVDRFSQEAGNLMVRSGNNNLPGQMNQ